MKRVLVGIALCLGAAAAHAADFPDTPPPAVPWSWSGLYFGGQIGAGLGLAHVADPVGPSLYGGDIRMPMGLIGGQIGYNWQAPNAPLVLGIEADAAAPGGSWTNTCLASSGYFVSANCRLRANATGSFTGRIGFASGLVGHTLLYAKGGLAWLREKIDVTTNGIDPSLTTALQSTKWGWTVGAGAEKALTPAWSVKLEYDYANFGRTDVALPTGYLQVLPPLNAYLTTSGGVGSVSQATHMVKLGLNLKLGESPDARWSPSPSDYRLRGSETDGGPADAEIEVGLRTWYAFGRFQKDLGGTSDGSQQNFLVSRLTYQTSAATGEAFGRIDSSENVVLKGFIGGGKITGGRMNDEDWVIFGAAVPYSNTLSDPVKGDVGYATIDLGYSLFTGPSSKIGGFVGYNYFRDSKSAYGCAQIANPYSDCVPSIPASVLVITEKDTWHSFRLGANSVVRLNDRLSLTVDAAYLPFVAFRGSDNHLLRTDVANTVSPETGRGQGVQLETALSYAIADSFSIGAGARYWAMWATSNAYTNIFGFPCPCQTLPARTEIYGAYLQASYKFNPTTGFGRIGRLF